MKRYISTASNLQLRSLASLTPEEIDALPEQFTCKIRVPSGLNRSPYEIVSKQKFLRDPEKCCIIDGYWGYATPHEIWLASDEDLKNYRARRIKELEDERKEFDRTFTRLSDYVCEL